MDYRVLTEAERKYTFSQSQQLSMQTGLIGYLRADFGSNGNEFWTTWNDFRKDLKTDEFKAEFDDVINGLRDGDVLSGRKAMSSYCYSTPDSSFNDDRNHYGIRLDTEKYSYLMRFNPNRGEYNLYCYCYQKEWLNAHLKNAERGIRFIDPHYQEQEGAPLVREFLADTGMTVAQIDRVAYLVGHHHSPAQINGIDYQILIEADYIVNASESGYDQQAIRTFMEHTMKTAAGIRLTKTVFGV